MGQSHSRSREQLGILIGVHIVVCCASLIRLAGVPIAFDPPTFHIFFDLSRWYVAAAVATAFAVVASMFVFARFSFGYFVGFYLYTMILGYLWLNCFTNLKYDHWIAGFSAAASAVAFLLPALFVTSPFRQSFVLSAKTFDRLLTFMLVLGIVTVLVGAAYNFRLVGIYDIYVFRDQLKSPTMVNYLIGMSSTALLPFAFGGFAARKAWWQAGGVLLLLLFFYPITLSKSTLLAPFWLFGVLLLAKLVEGRIAVVLSLLAPLLAGLVVVGLFDGKATALYLSIVNFRMVAIPSIAMDVYSDFFSKHDLTYFCQLSVLRRLVECPYREQLSVVMERTYHLGNFNGSLFTTEGIASVGIWFAPISALACGFVIALGNRVSAGLPAGFILVSAAVLPQALLNVPLSTVVLTHGAGLLFLLWYITPRAIFELD